MKTKEEIISEKDYNKIIDRVKNSLKTLNRQKIYVDLTLSAEDIVASAYIQAFENNPDVNITTKLIEKYIIISIKEENKGFSNLNPEYKNQDILRLNKWKIEHPEKIKEYYKRNSKIFTQRSRRWNIENKERYKINQKNYNDVMKVNGIKRIYKKQESWKIKEQVNRFKVNNPERWKEIQDKSNKRKVNELNDSYVRGIIKAENKKLGKENITITLQDISERRNKIIQNRSKIK